MLVKMASVLPCVERLKFGPTANAGPHWPGDRRGLGRISADRCRPAWRCANADVGSERRSRALTKVGHVSVDVVVGGVCVTAALHHPHSLRSMGSAPAPVDSHLLLVRRRWERELTNSAIAPTARRSSWGYSATEEQPSLHCETCCAVNDSPSPPIRVGSLADALAA
jgi:hypothetical protein